MRPWTPVATNLCIGPLSPRHIPTANEFDAVVTLSFAHGSHVGDGVAHLHIAVGDVDLLGITPTGELDVPPALAGAALWLMPRWHDGQRCLVRSVHPHRAELVIARLFELMGATTEEAINLLRRQRPGALTGPIAQQRPVQTDITELEPGTEYIRGSMPASQSGRDAARDALYDLLRTSSGELGCMPTEQIHVFVRARHCVCGRTTGEPDHTDQ